MYCWVGVLRRVHCRYTAPRKREVSPAWRSTSTPKPRRHKMPRRNLASRIRARYHACVPWKDQWNGGELGTLENVGRPGGRNTRYEGFTRHFTKKVSLRKSLRTKFVFLPDIVTPTG